MKLEYVRVEQIRIDYIGTDWSRVEHIEYKEYVGYVEYIAYIE